VAEQAADPELDLPPPASYVEGGDAWYDAVEFSAFIDAYLSVNYNLPKPQTGLNGQRAHDTANGFALSWAGVNASYPADPVGATLSLRFGPTAEQIAGGCFGPTTTACDSEFGLEFLKQGFASWKPGGADSKVTLDFGKFDTPYGVEVSESHLNLNYTRSFLYTLAQPLFHTGLRVGVAPAEAFDFKVLAVNGWNRSVDNNIGKTFGVQGTFHVPGAEGGDVLTASLGYMVGPERDDTVVVECPAGEKFAPDARTGCVADAGSAGESGTVDRASSNTEGLRHLLDLVVTANPIEQLRLVLNANYGLEMQRNEQALTTFDSKSYWGVLLGGRVAVFDSFGIAARGEYFSDLDGLATGKAGNEVNLASGTLTLELLPADFLTLRLDNRLDYSDRTIFTKEIRGETGYQFTTTLGVVAHTD